MKLLDRRIFISRCHGCADWLDVVHDPSNRLETLISYQLRLKGKTVVIDHGKVSKFGYITRLIIRAVTVCIKTHFQMAESLINNNLKFI